jgi:hypothetical protein
MDGPNLLEQSERILRWCDQHADRVASALAAVALAEQRHARYAGAASRAQAAVCVGEQPERDGLLAAAVGEALTAARRAGEQVRAVARAITEARDRLAAAIDREPDPWVRRAAVGRLAEIDQREAAVAEQQKKLHDRLDELWRLVF